MDGSLDMYIAHRHEVLSQGGDFAWCGETCGRQACERKRGNEGYAKYSLD